MIDAVQIAKNSNPVPVGKLNDMRAELARLNSLLVGTASDLSPSQYIEAKRYLNQVDDAVKALEDPSVTNYFNQTWVPKGSRVAELVKYMSDNGLVFAAAVPGEADAYRALYRALQNFEAGVAQGPASADRGR